MNATSCAAGSHTRGRNRTLTATLLPTSQKRPQAQAGMWFACFGVHVPFKLSSCFRRRTFVSSREHHRRRIPHLLAGITASVTGRLSRYTNGLKVGAWVGRLSRHTNWRDVGAWHRRGESLGHKQGARASCTGSWQQLQAPPSPFYTHARQRLALQANKGQ